MLRDTGSSLVIVDRKFVEKVNLDDCAKISLKFANSSSMVVPVTDVKLECPLYSGTVSAACVPSLASYVLLGNVPGVSCPCKVEVCEEDCSCVMCNFVVAEVSNAVETRGQIVADGRWRKHLLKLNIILLIFSINRGTEER